MLWQQKRMAVIGYARTSTRDQEAGLQAQIRDLIAAGCAERDIYTEQASSVRERPELDLLRRRILRPGDELVVTRLDRLARSARDTLAIAEEFGARGVTLKILDPAMTIEPPGSGRNRASPEANGSMAGAMSRMILTVMAAMAQLEREIMLERQREGIARAKAAGKYKGQPPHARAKAPQVIELAASGRTRSEIAAALAISERSVYRILAEARAKTA
jgi:DNA invertase Pin-like site-specific DNA recombinase